MAGARSRSIRKLPMRSRMPSSSSSRMPAISRRWSARRKPQRRSRDGFHADLEDSMSEDAAIPATPLFDRARSIKGYRLNKMAMALGKPENRKAFKDNEEAYLDSFGLSAEEKSAVMQRGWHAMVRLGRNLFFILT